MPHNFKIHLASLPIIKSFFFFWLCANAVKLHYTTFYFKNVILLQNHLIVDCRIQSFKIRLIFKNAQMHSNLFFYLN